MAGEFPRWVVMLQIDPVDGINLLEFWSTIIIDCLTVFIAFLFWPGGGTGPGMEEGQ